MSVPYGTLDVACCSKVATNALKSERLRLLEFTALIENPVPYSSAQIATWVAAEISALLKLPVLYTFTSEPACARKSLPCSMRPPILLQSLPEGGAPDRGPPVV